MNKEPGFIVAVKRNPLYDNPDLRNKANQDVLDFVERYVRYDKDGIKEYKLPWVKDHPKEFYCSEMINHFCLLHSGGKINLRMDGSDDDDITPWGIQSCKLLVDVTMFAGVYQWREMDYIITTSDSALAKQIRIESVGYKRRNDLTVGTHAGIIVLAEKRYWIAEMIGDGSVLSGIHKYKIK